MTENSNTLLAGSAYIELAESHLHDNVRLQSMGVVVSIPSNNDDLVKCHHEDKKLERIDRAVSELEMYHAQATLQPKIFVKKFPLFNNTRTLRSLVNDLNDVELKSKFASDYIKDTQYVWALPMLDEWTTVSADSWKTSTEPLLLKEEAVVSFLTKLSDLFLDYKENTRSDSMVILNVYNRPSLQEEQCTLIVQHVKQHVDSKYTHQTQPLDAGHVLQMYLKDALVVAQIRFRTVNAAKLHSLISMYHLPLSVGRSRTDEFGVTTFTKPFLVLSHILTQLNNACGSSKEVRVTAATKLFINCSLQQDHFHGVNLVIAAPCIEIVGLDRVINVSGNHNTNHASKPGKPKSTGKDGARGLDAEHGEPGESGGNVFIKCLQMINPEGLRIVSNGGNGANGADGGDGEDGGNGAYGRASKPTPVKNGWGRSYAAIGRGTAGEPGGKGGDGGGLSLGGEAGFGGHIDIEIGSHPTDDSPIQLSSENRPGKEGSQGTKMGQGGVGGKPGKDGIDILLYKLDVVTKMVEKKNKYRDTTQDLETGAGFGLGSNVLEPAPEMTETEFNSQQQRKQTDEQERNAGLNATAISKLHRQCAQRKVGCSKTSCMAEYLAQIDAGVSKNSVFVSAQMQQFYSLLTNRTIHADDQVDGEYLCAVRKVGQRATVLRQNVMKQQAECQAQQQRREEQQRETEIAQQIDADMTAAENASACECASAALACADLSPPYMELKRFYEARTALWIDFTSSQKCWAGRSISLPLELQKLSVKKVGDLIIHRFSELEEDAAFCDDFIFEPTVFADFMSFNFAVLCKSCTDEKPLSSELREMLLEAPVRDWAQRLCTVEECKSRVRGWFQRLVPPGSVEQMQDGSKRYLSRQWLVDQGFSVFETESLCNVLQNPHFGGLEPLSRKVACDMRSLYEVKSAGVSAAFNSKGEHCRFLHSRSSLRGEGELAKIFLDCLSELITIDDAVTRLHANSGLLLVLHALHRHIELEKAHLLEPLQYYLDLVLMLGRLSEFSCDDAVKVLLSSGVNRWPHLVKTFLLKARLTSSLGRVLGRVRSPSADQTVVTPDARSEDSEVVDSDGESARPEHLSLADRDILVVKVVCLLDHIQTMYGTVMMKALEKSIIRDCCSAKALRCVVTVLDSVFNVTSGHAAAIITAIKDAPLSEWSKRHCEATKRQTATATERSKVLTLNELIEALRSNPKNELAGVDWDHLREDVLAVHERCKELIKQRAAEIGPLYNKQKQELKACLNQPSYSAMRDHGENALIEAIALVCAVIHFRQKCLPRNHQLLSVLLALQTGKHKGTLLEVSTGQGKTMIVLMLALLRAMSGRTVDVLTSSRVLAKRDAEKAKAVCLELGFGVDSNDSDDATQRTAAYQNAIVYGEAGDFQRDYLLDRFQGMSVRGERKYEAAIIDEVDSMFLDKGDSMLYLSQGIPGMELLEGLFVYIWMAVNGPDSGLSVKKYVEQVKSFIENVIAEGGIVFPLFLADFVKSRIETWIESAIFAKGGLNDNDAYRLSSTRQGVVVMDKNTGTQMKSTHLSDGVQQFLQLKHLQRFKPETLKSVFVSSTKYFKMYTHLSGLSGTLGSDMECNLLSQVYGIAVTFVPTFKSCQRMQHDPVVCSSNSTRNAEVVRIAQQLVSQGRPVLVINSSIAEVLALADVFKQENISYKTYTTDDDHFAEEACPGDIILSTNLAGRGTDIKISPQMERAGGLHVILTFVPDNLRIERQAFGRAARQGERGSGQYVLAIGTKLDYVVASNVATVLAKEPARNVVDKLLFDRDSLERTRLYRLSAYRLLQIDLEECLLDKFHDQVVSHISKCETDERLIQTLSDSCREQFAFWLDTQKIAIQQVKGRGHDVELNASFNTLIAECNRAESDPLKRFKNFHYLLHLGKHCLAHKRLQRAKLIFNLIRKIEPDFQELAEYYSSAAIVNMDQHKYKQAINPLVRARYRLNQRMETISNFSCMMEQVRKCTMNSGKGLQSDLYSKQIESKLSILQALVSSIDLAIGNMSSDLSDISSTSLSEDTRAKVLDKLRESKLFLSEREISAFNYTARKIANLIRDTEYSAAVKLEIAAIIKQKGSSITPACFADTIGHADDLLDRLCKREILQVVPTQFSSFSTLLFHPLTDCLAAEDIVGGESVFCTVHQTRWSIEPLPSAAGDAQNRYSMSRPQTMDPTKSVTRNFSYVPKPAAGAKCLQFEPLSDLLNSVSSASLVVLKARREDLERWKNMIVRVVRTDNSMQRRGVCLDASVVRTDSVDKFCLKVRWSDDPSSSNPQAIIWIVDSGGAVTDLCMGEIGLQSVEWGLQTSYYVLRNSKAAGKIGALFREPLFCKRYPNVEGLHSYLLHHSKPTTADSASDTIEVSALECFTKEQIKLFPKDKACEKLFQQLQGYLILQPKSLDPNLADVEKDDKLAARRAIVLGCLIDVPWDVREKVCDDLMISVNGAFSNSRGTMRNSYSNGSDGTLVSTTTSLVDELQDNFNFSMRDELLDMAHLGIDSVVKFKSEPFWWGPLLVILLGIAQVILGACLTALGCPNLGSAFISEGVGDIAYGIEAYISGNFSFKAYLKHKLISIGMSILTCGVGACLSKGVSVARAGINSIIKKVIKKVIEAGVNALSGLAIDKVMDETIKKVVECVVQKYAEHMQPGFTKVKALLLNLLQKTGDERAVRNFMDQMSAAFFNAQAVADAVIQYATKVVQAVAAGIGNALKQCTTHMAGFSGLQAAAKMVSMIMKAVNITSTVVRACTEMAQFVLAARNKIEKEIDGAHQANAGNNVGEPAFIDSEIARWNTMVQERMVSYIHDGILKPEVKQMVNGCLNKLGNKIKNSVFKTDLLADPKLQASLATAREKNMHKLASKDAMFGGEKDARTVTDVLRDAKDAKVVHPADDVICANTDHYTVAQLKEKFPGVIFYEVGEGSERRIVFLSPQTFKSCIDKKVADDVYQDHCPMYRLEEGKDSMTTKNGDGNAHRVPLVDGEEITIPPLAAGGNFCDEQTRLFNFKLRELSKNGEIATTPEHIAEAMAHATDPVAVYALRQEMLQSAPQVIRSHGPSVRRDVQLGIPPRRFENPLEQFDHNAKVIADEILQIPELEGSFLGELENCTEAIANKLLSKKERTTQNPSKVWLGENMPSGTAMHHIISEEIIRQELSNLTNDDLKQYWDSCSKPMQARMLEMHKDGNRGNPKDIIVSMILFDPRNVRIGPKSRTDDGGSGFDIALVPPDKQARALAIRADPNLKITQKILALDELRCGNPVFKADKDSFCVSHYAEYNVDHQQPGGRIYSGHPFDPTKWEFEDLNRRR